MSRTASVLGTALTAVAVTISASPVAATSSEWWTPPRWRCVPVVCAAPFVGLTPSQLATEVDAAAAATGRPAADVLVERIDIAARARIDEVANDTLDGPQMENLFAVISQQHELRAVLVAYAAGADVPFPTPGA